MTRMIAVCGAVMVLLMAGSVGAGQAGAAQGRGGTVSQPSAGSNPVIVFETVKGTFEMETYPNEAPKSVEHILTLVRRNFYNGLRVHRAEPGFVVQFGDPNTRDMTKRDRWGTGGSGRAVGVAEVKRTHRLGAVALAHGGDPSQADSQMYIALAPAARYAHLEGKYTIIGQITAGIDVVQKLQLNDIIRRVTVKGETAARR
jgi:peptidyl-prolyl cis-trans isomerase B (cyclophilin B)